jgi:2-dehydropantoate 2-reductase
MENQWGPLRIAVVGVGGVGGLLGGLLSRSGEFVTFVATESTASALENGLTINSSRYGSFTTPSRAVTRLTAPVDVCVVAVKSTQLEAAMSRVAMSSVDEAIIVPLLNGIEHVADLRVLYDRRVVPATMRVASTRVAPAVIEHTSPFVRIELAEPQDDGRRDRVAAFKASLEQAGVDVDLRDDEGAMLWEKLIFLCPLALLTTRYGMSAGEVRTVHRDELVAMIDEIAIVAAASGITVSADDAVKFFDSVPPTMQSSMQHDAAAGLPIEIEAIGGAVLRAASTAGVSTPVTLRLVDALRQTTSS